MKNPIAIVLGSILRETRNNFNIQTQELADKIGINISYYRLLESGTHVIHISKTIDLINAFNHFGANLSYDGMSKVIMGIYYTQPLISEGNNKILSLKIEKLLENLKILDYKLFLLIKLFQDNQLFYMNNKNKTLLDNSNNNKFKVELSNLLSRFNEFGKEETEIKNETVQKIFRDLPTLYYEFVDNFVNELLNLPMGFRVNDLYKWENRNTEKQNIKELYALIRYKDSIIDDNNFKKYQYRYLWNNNFEQAHIVFITKMNKKEVEKEFKSKLYNAIKESPILKEKFEAAFNKLKIAVIDMTEEESFNIFSEEGDSIDYNLAWVFGLTSQIHVGLKAKVYFDKNKINEFRDFISLDFNGSQKLLQQIKNLI